METDRATEAIVAWVEGMEPGAWARAYAGVVIDVIHQRSKSVLEANQVVQRMKRVVDMSLALNEEIIRADAVAAAAIAPADKVLPTGPSKKTPTAARLAQWNAALRDKAQALGIYRATVNLARATFLLGASVAMNGSTPADGTATERRDQSIDQLRDLLANLPADTAAALKPLLDFAQQHPVPDSAAPWMGPDTPPAIFDAAFKLYQRQTGKNPLEDWTAWEAWAAQHPEHFQELPAEPTAPAEVP